jgi:hypothetical protein
MAEAVAVKLAIMATTIMNWLKGVDCEGACVESVGLVESGVSGRSGDAGDSWSVMPESDDGALGNSGEAEGPRL